MTTINTDASNMQLYAEFARDTDKLLNSYIASVEEDKQATLVELDQIAKFIPTLKADTPESATNLAYNFKKDLAGYEGEDAGQRVQVFADRITRIACNQQRLLGEARSIVIALHQRTSVAIVRNEIYGPVSREIRARARRVLLDQANSGGRQ